ncbi:hypothetical protein EI555_012543 [Monodon monoceros]|uniref:Interferon-induced GTP-binding protein Mx1 n=1 Tax=Monodon monoceros TaxID=40151 RepID=A0A4U1F8X6_MONMO|nr:hypothetical protein EI555_012543 [Monodon monoceros]
MESCPGSAFPVACAAGCDGVEPAHLVFRVEAGLGSWELERREIPSAVPTSKLPAILSADTGKKMVHSDLKMKEPDSPSASSHLLLNGNDDLVGKNEETGSENNLYNQYEEKVRPCSDLIDSLRALGVEQGLALLFIAVTGDQSSGKSSVLEALSGFALPRGSDKLCWASLLQATRHPGDQWFKGRCPLVLKLKTRVNEDEWKEAKSVSGTRRLRFQMLRRWKRKSVTVAIAGEGMGISHELINLEVTSPHVPDLTLIDLPSITRIAVGNQPANTEYQIKSLIRKYILKQETINLVVVPANVDITTMEALCMAQEVDLQGQDHSLWVAGILTKPDLVDKSTEDKVVDVVRNLVFHLKKGYMIIKCRGQQDIQHQLSLTKALQKEQDFFGNHAHFRDLLEEGRATVPCLAERLTTELIVHICKSLPLLENQIKESHQRITEELQSMAQISRKTQKIDAFNKDITNIIEGEEFVGEYDSRLFNKMRTEFYRWSIVVANNFWKGESKAPWETLRSAPAISSHTPWMLKTFGQLRKGMLQNKDRYDRLLKERSDTSDRRKLLREPLQRLTRARLAKFLG